GCWFRGNGVPRGGGEGRAWRLVLLLLVVLVPADRLARHGVAAVEPAPEIDIGTMFRAERTIGLDGGLAADRAAPLFALAAVPLPRLARAWPHSLANARTHSVSTSALESQRWLTGKPSLWSSPTTSVRGRPTTLV